MAPHALLTRFALLLLAAAAASAAADGCRSGGCALALASFPVAQNQTLTSVAALFGIRDYRTLAPYNPQYPNLDFIPAGGLVRIPFRCDCLTLQKPPFAAYLAGAFPYTVSPAETYTSIAARFRNLTTPDWLDRANTFPATNIPDTGVTLNVTVNCSCGDRGVSPDYGLFLTAPLRVGDGQTTLAAAAAANGFDSSSAQQMELLQKYNPGMDTATSGLVFIPVKGDHH